MTLGDTDRSMDTSRDKDEGWDLLNGKTSHIRTRTELTGIILCGDCRFGDVLHRSHIAFSLRRIYAKVRVRCGIWKNPIRSLGQ